MHLRNYSEYDLSGCTLFFAYIMIYDESKEGGHFHVLNIILFALKLYLFILRAWTTVLFIHVNPKIKDRIFVPVETRPPVWFV